MTTEKHIRRHGHHRRLALVLLVCTTSLFGTSSLTAAGSAAPQAAVRTWTIHYRAHNSVVRDATVILPSWYGSKRNPRVPVVISPHGRNGTGLGNAKYFGNLPAIGRFAVICPDGMGRRLALKSYAYRGQIDDLAKMPDIAERALPWLHLDRTRIYALGSSMGGHETLMLLARHPKLLAGAVAMDSVTDLSRRYRQLPDTACDATCVKSHGKPYGVVLQAAMRNEVGGTPTQVPRAYAARSPLAFAEAIATSGVALQIWWSTEDRIVTDQQHQSGVLFATLRNLRPDARVSAYVGRWPHSKEMKASQLLPIALHELGLLPSTKTLPRSVSHLTIPGQDL